MRPRFVLSAKEGERGARESIDMRASVCVLYTRMLAGPRRQSWLVRAQTYPAYVNPLGVLTAFPHPF